MRRTAAEAADAEVFEEGFEVAGIEVEDIEVDDKIIQVIHKEAEDSSRIMERTVRADHSTNRKQKNVSAMAAEKQGTSGQHAPNEAQGLKSKGH